MKLIIEIPVYSSEDIEKMGMKTRPFEYATVVGLKAALKQQVEKLIDTGSVLKGKKADWCFEHAGYELNLKDLIIDGVYEEPNIYTVNEFFNQYKTK